MIESPETHNHFPYSGVFLFGLCGLTSMCNLTGPSSTYGVHGLTLARFEPTNACIFVRDDIGWPSIANTFLNRYRMEALSTSLSAHTQWENKKLKWALPDESGSVYMYFDIRSVAIGSYSRSWWFADMGRNLWACSMRLRHT